MRRSVWAAAAGVALIVVGTLFLLENLGLVSVGGVIGPILFGLGGPAFGYMLVADRRAWWAAIPACALLGLAAMLACERYGPAGAGSWAPALFMAALAAAFWIIYLRNRENWWAIIPGGVILTLALVVGLSSALDGSPGAGGAFFLGLAATFFVLSFVQTPQGRLKWALIPAGVLLLLGLFLVLIPLGLLTYAVPSILILVGLYFISRLLVRRPGGK